MTVVRLSESVAGQVPEYQAVRDDALARRKGWFIAEGRAVVTRLVADCRCRVRSVLLNEPSWTALEPALKGLPDDVLIYVCPSRTLEALTGFNLHRGCIALADRPPEALFSDVMRGVSDVIVLDGVADPDNVGGVFRNAAAFGAEAVLLSPTCCDPLYRKAIRTSMAATFRVPFARVQPWPGGLEELKRAGFVLAALTPRPAAESLDAFVKRPRPSRLAILVGTEGAGLSDEVLALADVQVRIPTTPAVDSLNLAVATGIALSRLVGQNLV